MLLNFEKYQFIAVETFYLWIRAVGSRARVNRNGVRSRTVTVVLASKVDLFLTPGQSQQADRN
jgi:hypothetical protein